MRNWHQWNRIWMMQFQRNGPLSSESVKDRPGGEGNWAESQEAVAKTRLNFLKEP